jgi:4-hydroxybenzoate polyprenyltransferase
MRKEIKELVRLYRINHWYYYLGFTLIGFSMVSPLQWRLIFLIYSGSMMLAYAYSLNDFCDKYMKLKKLYFLYPLVFLIPSFYFLTSLQLLLVTAFLLIATFYSVNPPRLKSKPFVSSLCNAFGFSILFLLGYSIVFPDVKAFLFFFLFFLFNLVAQFIHEILHIKEDKKNKDITTAVLLGERKTRKLSCICLVFSLIIVFYLFLLGILKLVTFLATFSFIVFHSYRISTSKIDIKLRKIYRISGMLLGLLYFFSFIRS